MGSDLNSAVLEAGIMRPAMEDISAACPDGLTAMGEADQGG